MQKLLRVFLLIALAALLAGCQATPENGVVVRKDLQQMLDMASSPQEKQSSLMEKLGVPERYEADFMDATGTVRVTADAAVALPETDSIPVVRVTPKAFGQDTVDALVGALFGDGQLYDTESLAVLTKDDIAALLTSFKQTKAALEAQGMKPETNGGESEPPPSEAGGSEAAARSGNQLDEINQTIGLYEKLLAEAPEQKDAVEVTGAMQTEDGVAYVHLGQPCETGGIASLFVVNSEHSQYAQYLRRGDYDSAAGMYFTPKEWEQSGMDRGRAVAATLEYPSITREQAQEIADNLLTRIGVDYLQCTVVEQVIGGSSSEYAGSGTPTGNTIKAYRLQYVRTVGGIPVTYANVDSAWDDTAADNIWIWTYERMTLIINDSGIVEMVWDSPYTMGDTVIEDAALLPYAKVQDVFEKMILINSVDESQTRAELNIGAVCLGYARITEQNSLMQGLLIPAWDFFGNKTVYFKDAEGNTQSYTSWNETGQSMLTINAIDGSVIDRTKGY